MDVEMVFNELSAQSSAPDIYIAREWMSTFIQTTVMAAGFGVSRILRIEEDFHNMLLASDYSLNKWRNDRQVDDEQRRYFNSLVTKIPPLSDFEETEIEDQYILSEFSHNGKFSSGLGIAYLLDALALSLNSDPKWNESQIHLQTNGNAVTTYHASSPNHVRENADWIREQREKDDPWLKHGLPRNGRCPYLPPKRYYSEKLADFPTERYSDDRRGFKDRKKQLWLWHKEEQHWDVQFKPYKEGNYFRVTPDGRFLDQ